MADAFEQVDTNMEPSAAQVNKANNKSTKRKRDGDGLGIDEEIQVKTRRPVFKLDDDLYVNQISSPLVMGVVGADMMAVYVGYYPTKGFRNYDNLRNGSYGSKGKGMR